MLAGIYQLYGYLHKIIWLLKVAAGKELINCLLCVTPVGESVLLRVGCQKYQNV